MLSLRWRRGSYQTRRGTFENYVHNCADRSDKETFVGVLNRFVAEVTREISLAPDEANETSDQLIATELGNSKTQSTAPLAQTAAQDTIGSAVVASDAVTSSVWGICEPLVPLPAMPLCPAAAAVHMKATFKIFFEQARRPLDINFGNARCGAGCSIESRLVTF